MRQSLAVQGRRRAWTVLGIAGGAPLLAALAVVLLLPDPPPAPTAAPTPSPPAAAAPGTDRTATTATPSTATARPPGEPADLTEVSAAVAATDLSVAGVEVDGAISGAWEWTDQRGRNLLATVRAVDEQADDGSATTVSLRAYYVTGLDGRPRVLRRVRDPSLSCEDDATVVADFARSATTVRDLDGDGSAEVAVGWSSRCGEPTAASRVRLAVMAGSRLFVLRGDGVVTGSAVDGSAVGDSPVGDSSGGAAGEAPTPAPDASDWPTGLLDPALSLFRTAFY